MEDVIRLLPQSVADQIAAGEVVENPASVVKELVENAVDAKARNIEIILLESGRSLIQVSDDGWGMSERDARMCFERHATSKIKSTEDIFNILTKGFRGEALAAISAIAQIELITKRPTDEAATKIRVEGSKFISSEKSARTQGTTISVSNLFFNVPARRKFLKKDSAEEHKVITQIQRIALAHPEIGFLLIINGKEIYRLPQTEKLINRILNVLKKQTFPGLIPVSETLPDFSITGYVGLPKLATLTRNDQFIFVNHRFVESRQLSHAITTAFGDLIPDKKHPLFIIYLQLPPNSFDINISPTKTLVKLEDERLLYQTLHSAVRRIIAQMQLNPTIDFERTGFEDRLMNTGTNDKPKTITVTIPSGSGSSKNWFEGNKPSRAAIDFDKQLERFEGGLTVLPNPSKQFPTIASTEPENKMLVNSFVGLGNKFVVFTSENHWYLLNLQACLQRIADEKLRLRIKNRELSVQQLLFPEQVSLASATMRLLEQHKDLFKSLGIDFEIAGKDSIIVNGLDVELKGLDTKSIFELLEASLSLDGQLPESVIEEAIIASTRNAKVTSDYRIDHLTQLQNLIDRLMASSNPSFAPDGKPTIKQLSESDFNALLNA